MGSWTGGFTLPREISRVLTKLYSLPLSWGKHNETQAQARTAAHGTAPFPSTSFTFLSRDQNRPIILGITLRTVMLEESNGPHSPYVPKQLLNLAYNWSYWP